MQRQTPQARPALISGEVLVLSGTPLASTGKREGASDDVVRTFCDQTSPIRFAAIDAQLDPATVARLTPAQLALLQQE